MKLRHYQAYYEQNVVIRHTALSGILHFQAYKKFSGVSLSRSTQKWNDASLQETRKSTQSNLVGK